jgi:hypothetical protein
MKADSPSAGRLTRFLAADPAPAAFDRGGGGAGRKIFIPGNKESPTVMASGASPRTLLMLQRAPTSGRSRARKSPAVIAGLLN